MNKLLNNKIILVLITLTLGAFIGWWIKPTESGSVENHDHAHELESISLWTCSMHPQVQLTEPGDCPICGMDLIPANSEGNEDNESPVLKMTESSMALAQIQTIQVGSTGGESKLELTGKIQADERESASITAKFPGRIERLYVSFTGEKVIKGQKLASIYSPELLSAQQELLEASKIKSDFPEIYQAAKQKLRLWKLSEEQISSIEVAGKIQEQFDVFAEHGGIVMGRNVAVGDYITTGQALFQIVNLDKVWVILDAYESDLDQIQVGTPIQFTVAGIPNKKFSSKVSFVDPVINPETRVAAVRAELPNGQGKLLPEMFVKAEISKNRNSQTTILVPRTAVLWSGKRSVVYVKVPNQSPAGFEMREVEIGALQGDNYTVLSGLENGEEIVVNGAFTIDAASQLAGKPSLMSRTSSNQVDVTENFSKGFNQLADYYFELKNQLASDQWKVNNKIWAGIRNSLKLMENEGKTTIQPSVWLGVLSDLEKSKGIKEARVNFNNLSELIIEANETYGLANRVVYKDYCPMAFGDEGAYWLSEKKEILNPYFGASMLTCGEVKETYRN
ncbi:efflux RND transporter periplasmic adaptor subunit [Algoriphagus marincola]|uniref:Efflux RND transporter periplasmic adaptor subunit n=1 Tax=Algoriphagus marincola TaxID=264027 RepID=A0ABS7N0H5_9BACT|nr:efflux RND transporter periplasmic adaptor subunit [Algoriphagus marincola]MBY5949809.1 efflux RND transporter periplasmic adaptor subunit [Algoriphagus marincola]